MTFDSALFGGAASSDFWLTRLVLQRGLAAIYAIGFLVAVNQSTCLVYHYNTQPIPNPVSWYLDKSPLFINKLGVLFNHLAEVIVPFGYIVPNVVILRIAGLITVLFQGSIIVSGNLSWLNWLTMVIALSCFDEGLLARVLPVKPAALEPLATSHQAALGVLSLVVVVLSIRPAMNLLSRRQMMNTSFEPLHLVNTYGAFGSISRKRYEVILEGTTDTIITQGTAWREYEFRAKPGSVGRSLPFLAPYHRRLDWLMWFIPLTPGGGEVWYAALIGRLLQNDAPTLSLMAGNPFPNSPPMWIRGSFYDYRLTTAEERRTTGNIWSRSRVADMMRPISLTTPGFVPALESMGWVR